MKKILMALALCLSLQAFAQTDCDIQLMVLPASQGDSVPQRVTDNLLLRLTNIVASAGITGSKDYCPFFITAAFSHSFVETVPGPPVQHALTTTLTLYIGDVRQQQVFASHAVDLRGVGRSQEKALMNALGRLNAKNAEIVQFVEDGKQRVVDHFNEHYATYIEQAKRAQAEGKTDEALYNLTLIPTCSDGAREADALITKIMKKEKKTDSQEMPETKETTAAAPARKAAKAVAQAWNQKQKRSKISLEFLKFK